MKTYYRNIIRPIHIEDKGQIFHHDVGDRVLTSEVRVVDGEAVITILENHWVTLSFEYFEGMDPAYGHAPFPTPTLK